MLKSCAYCGKIHDRKFECRQKREAIKKRQQKSSDAENRFRWSAVWKKKAIEIKERDLYMCQACVRMMEGTDTQYNVHDLSVHHIKGLRDDFELRLENENLITLCRQHHEMADDGRITAASLREAAVEQEKRYTQR